MSKLISALVLACLVPSLALALDLPAAPDSVLAYPNPCSGEVTIFQSTVADSAIYFYPTRDVNARLPLEKLLPDSAKGTDLVTVNCTATQATIYNIWGDAYVQVLFSSSAADTSVWMGPLDIDPAKAPTMFEFDFPVYGIRVKDETDSCRVLIIFN